MTPSQAHVAEEYLKVFPKLRRYALSLTLDRDKADDLLQDVFIRAITYADNYQPGTNFAGWIFRLTRNHYIDQRRSSKNKPQENVDDHLHLSTLPAQGAAIERDRLIRLIKLLPKDTRLVLLMAGMEKMNYEQIASHLRCEVGTVKSKISRARDLLDGML